jgi:lysophospholipase L1-like esterase
MPAREKKKAFSLKITSEENNDFLGLCLDCKKGVTVDNIPLRGSSGLELLKINPAFLQEQIRRLNVKLVILQFGVNIVPYESDGFLWYENALIKVVKTIKRATPDVQVLIVGVSDMAKKENGSWISYPNIASIKTAQKNAAKRTNSAFWDLHQVMGGENSIVAWANAEPPLAGKDFIHLTPKGAQVIGEFLFQALGSVKFKQSQNIIQ